MFPISYFFSDFTGICACYFCLLPIWLFYQSQFLFSTMIFLHDGLPLIAYLIPYFSLILLSTLEQVCIHNSTFSLTNFNFPPMTWAKSAAKPLINFPETHFFKGLQKLKKIANPSLICKMLFLFGSKSKKEKNMASK